MEKNQICQKYCIKTVQGLYDNQSNHQPDLLVLRHVLEHQSNVKEFISNISHENPEYIFIEIPCYEFVSRKIIISFHMSIVVTFQSIVLNC